MPKTPSKKRKLQTTGLWSAFMEKKKNARQRWPLELNNTGIISPGYGINETTFDKAELLHEESKFFKEIHKLLREELDNTSACNSETSTNGTGNNSSYISSCSSSQISATTISDSAGDSRVLQCNSDSEASKNQSDNCDLGFEFSP